MALPWHDTTSHTSRHNAVVTAVRVWQHRKEQSLTILDDVRERAVADEEDRHRRQAELLARRAEPGDGFKARSGHSHQMMRRGMMRHEEEEAVSLAAELEAAAIANAADKIASVEARLARWIEEVMTRW
jgi:hypothetical protein